MNFAQNCFFAAFGSASTSCGRQDDQKFRSRLEHAFTAVQLATGIRFSASGARRGQLTKTEHGKVETVQYHNRDELLLFIEELLVPEDPLRHVRGRAARRRAGQQLWAEGGR